MTNIDIAKTYIKAVQTGDQATLGRIFSPNVVWHQPENNQFSGVHQGMAAVGSILGKMLEVSNGTFAITKADHFMANGDWVAITIEFSAEANGLKLSQPGVDLMPSMAARLSKLVSSPRTRKKKTGYGASELCIALRRTGSGEDVADGREAQRLC